MDRPDQRGLVEDHFGRFASTWADLYTGGVPFQRYNFLIRRQQVLALLGRPGGRVLDVGCGPGTFIPALLEVADEVVAVDSASAMIEKATALRDSLPEPHRVQLSVADVARLDFPDQHFDAIVGVGLIEYIDDVDQIFNELYRVLRPGGTLVLTFPNFISPFKVYERLSGDLRSLIRNTIKRLIGREIEPSHVHHHFVPWSVDRRLERAGLIKVDQAYCAFGVYTAVRLSSLFLWLSQKLEKFSKPPVGLLAVNYNVRLTRQ